MTQTADQLTARVLADLNVVGAGQTAAAEDTEFVDGVVVTTLAELNGRDIINVVADDGIEDELFEPIVEYLVNKLGPSYGKPPVDNDTFLLIENRMKDIVRPSATKTTLGTETVLRQGAWPGALRTQW